MLTRFIGRTVWLLLCIITKELCLRPVLTQSNKRLQRYSLLPLASKLSPTYFEKHASISPYSIFKSPCPLTTRKVAIC
ncbi:hypothetical protein V8E36_006637 [Tilletia maclaganii]